MLNEVKHLGQGRQAGIVAQGACHAVPRSFVAAQSLPHSTALRAGPEHGRRDDIHRVTDGRR